MSGVERLERAERTVGLVHALIGLVLMLLGLAVAGATQLADLRHGQAEASAGLARHERALDVLGQMNERLSRIEGALGVKR